MEITLSRKKSNKDVTLGHLYVRGWECLTLELPWKKNAPNISCIPAGTYPIERYDSPKRGKVWMLHDVPDRSFIEIHAGNTVLDTNGCIILGLKPGSLHGLDAVLNSRLALSQFHKLLEKFDIGTITIIGVQ